MALNKSISFENKVGKANRNSWVVMSCIVLCIIVFIFDLMVPLGVAGGVPYVMVIMLALNGTKDSHVISFAILCSLLTMLGLFVSESGGIKWMVLANRTLALIAIWATALLGVQLKRVQLKLNESEGRFQLMADQAPLMIWQTDDDGRWDFLSKGWLDYTGIENEKSFGYGWLEVIELSDRNRVTTRYQHALSQHEPFQIDCRLQKKDQDYHWVTIHGAPHFLDNDKFAGYVGTILDINDRKEAELTLEHTRQRLFHKEKMEAIGLLSSGILHEIGNPVAGIAGLVQQMLEQIRSNEIACTSQGFTYEQNLVMVLDYLNKLILINRDISDFTTMHGGTEEHIDINDLIDRTCRLLSHDERMLGIKFDLKLDRTLPAVRIKTDHFIQVLLNLLENAIAACYKNNVGKNIVVTTSTDSGSVFFEINDDGSGMSLDELAKATDAFFTTKSKGKGMGLGLTTCKAIINEYGGELDITSNLGQGSTVRVSFPKN